jgi:aspartate/methionine/tyrosine aminotransferase
MEAFVATRSIGNCREAVHGRKKLNDCGPSDGIESPPRILVFETFIAPFAPTEPIWSHTRLPDRLTSTDFARRLASLCDELGDELLDVTVGDPTSSCPEARARARSHLASSVDETFERSYQPHPRGMREARRAIVDYYEARGIDVPIDRIVLTASTSEAYTWLGKMLCEPGERLAVPEPSYPLFEHLLTLECIEPLDYRFAYDGLWHLDGRALERLETAPDLRGVIAVSPNNPTGHALDAETFERLADLAVARDIPLIVDEVFADYPVDATRLPRALEHVRRRDPDQRPLVFVLSGLSKVAGLPGAKMSWIAVEGPPDRREEALERLEFVGDAFLSVSTVTQLAAPGIVGDLEAIQSELRERLEANREVVRGRAEGSVGTAYPVEGGWYQVLRWPGFVDEAEFVLELLDERGVLVQPGFFYDFDVGTHTVVSLLTPCDPFERGMDALFEVADTRF